MATSNLTLSKGAISAITALQHPCGTYLYYRETLDRLYTHILHQSDELGMSDTEAIGTLRVLDALRSDLAAIAGPVAVPGAVLPEDKPLSEKVELLAPDQAKLESDDSVADCEPDNYDENDNE